MTRPGRGKVYVAVRASGISTKSMTDRFACTNIPCPSIIELESIRVGSKEGVVIKGSRLASATSVTFSGVEAQFRVVSATRIIAVLPRKKLLKAPDRLMHVRVTTKWGHVTHNTGLQVGYMR